MKKLILVFLPLLLFTNFIGCETNEGKPIELIYDSLSEKEEFLFNLTGNKILMYNLTNIPENKEIQILLTYEVYEKDKKIKEEIITGMTTEIVEDKLFGEEPLLVETENNTTIGLNIQNDKIRYLLSRNGGYSSGNFEIKEDLSQFSQGFLVNNTSLELGKEIYIYFATPSRSLSSIPLGTPIDLNETNEILKSNDSTILIKLSFKEA